MAPNQSAVYGFLRMLRRPRAAMNSIRRLWAYYRDQETSAPPLSVVWEITNACDARCGFCDTHGLHKRQGTPSLDKALGIARALGDGGVSMVGISGGEPLLFPHLIPVLHELNRYGIEVSLCTNGSQLERMVDPLIEAGVHAITISVDGVSPDEHNKIRGHKSLFQRIEKGIEAFDAHPKGKSVALRVRFVITPENFNQVLPFAEMWRKRVAEVVFQPVQNHGSGDTHHFTGDEFVFQQEKRQRFDAIIADLATAHPEYDTPFYRNMPEFLFSPQTLKNRFHCLVPALAVKVLAHGDVVTCSNSEQILGNLTNESLDKAWNHPEIQDLRSKSRHQCRECLCWINPMQVNDIVPRATAQLIPASTASPGDK